MDFTDRYGDLVEGTLECFDRIIIWGTLPDIGYAKAMFNWLFAHKVRICEYGEWSKQRHDLIKKHAEQLSSDHGVPIQFLRRTQQKRKEDIVAEILSNRGDGPGLICILSAMEGCPCYRYYPMGQGKWGIRGDEGKCCHYYFYFMDEDLGLCSMRVPTWSPFRLQFYCNGHSALAAALKRNGIAFRTEDNALVEIADLGRAQQLADELSAELLRSKLEHYAQMLCPVGKEFPSGWHWSLRQIEYSSDVIFAKADRLGPIYQELVRKSIEQVRVNDVARFLGRPVHPSYLGEVGSNFHTRIEGTRIKHHYGEASIKMYDKRGRILRVETTCNNPSFFKHHREVVHKDGTRENKLAQVKRSLYSLGVLGQLMRSCNGRYLQYLSGLEQESEGRQKLEDLSQSRRVNDRSWRGFNFFGSQDAELLRAIAQAQWNLKGLSTRSLRQLLPDKTPWWIRRQIKRLRVFGLIKKLGGQLRYHLTKLGRKVIAAALKVHEWAATKALGSAGPEAALDQL